MKVVERLNESRQPPAPIQDRLKAVNASSLEDLLRIRDEQRRIQTYRAKAEELKSGVTPAVHARVMDDYATRSTALGLQSAPLESEARAEYRKLRALIVEVQKTHQQASQQREELEFRHAVGELDDAQLAAGLEAPRGVIAQCEKDQAVLDEQAARFVDALGGDQIQNEPEPEPARIVVGGKGEVKDADPAARGQKAAPRTAQSPPPPKAVSVTGPGGLSPDHTLVNDDATSLALPDALAEFADMARPSTPSRPASLVPAALLVTDATALPQEYALTMVNGIGRSDENQIQIIKPGISRAHAVVRAVAGGFVIKDLDSQNGTFVNGERATECQLADGDIVEVGTVRFVFRMPWPAPDAPVTPGGRPTGKR